MTALTEELPVDVDLGTQLGRRLDRDARRAAALMPLEEVRYVVDLYYDIQKTRIGAGNQVSAAMRNELPPAELLQGLHVGLADTEARAAAILNAWVKGQPMGQWLLGIKGIGPVLAAGLMAHIDVNRARTAGAVWRFAGLDPTIVWGKGEKRPYNAKLKTLCWKVGESFIKVSGNPDSLYGRLYKERKALEEQRNDSGANAEKATAVLASTRAPGRGTEARKALELGRLPQAQVHARARRYAVKIFLSHLHQAMWQLTFDEPAPVPFPIAHQGHIDFTQPEVPFPVRPVA